jgi:hypothetical protein
VLETQSSMNTSRRGDLGDDDTLRIERADGLGVGATRGTPAAFLYGQPLASAVLYDPQTVGCRPRLTAATARVATTLHSANGSEQRK